MMAATTETRNGQRPISADLVAALAALRQRLRGSGSDPPAGRGARAAMTLPAPPALDALAPTFGLSPFERDVLLLCAGIELDAGFAPACAPPPRATRAGPMPTFSLALAALPDAALERPDARPRRCGAGGWSRSRRSRGRR